MPRDLRFFEKHYYIESSKGFTEIHDADLQEKIEAHMKKHHNLPLHNTSREAGFSSIELPVGKGQPFKFNPSLLEAKPEKSKVIVSRLKSAPELPVSCLASAEHVIAMQNSVKDFVDEYQPKSKKHVMYQILVKEYLPDRAKVKNNIDVLKTTLLDHDAQLKASDISIHADSKKGLYCIEISTQSGDIQTLIKSIKKLKKFRIINTDFDTVNLNEGLCLIRGDASNPIHALVNIASTDGMKGFLERDAGLTSGKKTHLYQDNHWTFNLYSSLEDLQQRAGYSDKSYAVKLVLKP